MKAFKGYEETKAYGSGMEQLPKGGYVCKIMKASVESGQYGEQLVVALDIAEGEYKDFFANDYRAQDREDKKWHGNYYLSIPTDDGSEKDGWTKRKFKTFTEALEASNDGYHFDWDEKKFKGLSIGGLFNMREYKTRDGNVGRSPNLAQVTSVEKIRAGKYKVPKDQLLSGSQGGTPAPADSQSGFTVVNDDDLPF